MCNEATVDRIVAPAILMSLSSGESHVETDARFAPSERRRLAVRLVSKAVAVAQVTHVEVPKRRAGSCARFG